MATEEVSTSKTSKCGIAAPLSRDVLVPWLLTGLGQASDKNKPRNGHTFTTHQHCVFYAHDY